MPGTQAGARVALAERSLMLTRQMLEAAAKGDWEQVEAWERDRAEGLRGALGDPPGPELAARLVPLLQKTAELNVRLTALAAAERETRGQQSKRLRDGRRAARAYGEPSR